MKTKLLISLLLALSACASRDIDVESGGPADAGAELAASPEPIGALASSFDPERAAPAPTPAADHDPHAHHHDHDAQAPSQDAATEYTCPHHPEVKSDKPGVCPKCKMDLVPVQPKPKTAPEHDHGAHQ